MSSLKNWDNKTWLSSLRYIQKFNNFLLRQKKLDKNSAILDIGCGRGKIIGNLYKKLKLKKKPIGIDIESHKDKDKNMIFKKQNAVSFLNKTKKKFDLILIKQTIHLFKINEIIKLLNICKKSLSENGKIIIFSLDPYDNEIPTFYLMKKKIDSSLRRDIKIFNLINKLNFSIVRSKFIFNVNISKKKYLDMVKKRYISTLLNLSEKQILNGLIEINCNYSENLIFKDKLICLSLSNN